MVRRDDGGAWAREGGKLGALGWGRALCTTGGVVGKAPKVSRYPSYLTHAHRIAQGKKRQKKHIPIMGDTQTRRTSPAHPPTPLPLQGPHRPRHRACEPRKQRSLVRIIFIPSLPRAEPECNGPRGPCRCPTHSSVSPCRGRRWTYCKLRSRVFEMEGPSQKPHGLGVAVIEMR